MDKHNPVGDGVPTNFANTSAVLMSRNEIASLCSKAARGAGMNWGLAEEAGHAAAWLATRGLTGPSNLAVHFKFAEGQSWQNVCPQVEAGQWQTRTGTPLCPVALGATLSDYALLPGTSFTSDGLKTGPVSCPLLVLPFLASAATAIGNTIKLSWDGGTVGLTTTGEVFGDTSELSATSITQIHIWIEEPGAAHTQAASMTPIDPETLDQLSQLAMKTTVPPSDRSREGAGAGTSDND
jgi:uncharacterized protein DUF3726